MFPNDRADLYLALSMACELYNKPQLSEGAMGMWFDALVRYEIEAVTGALTAHVNDPDTGQFFPKPADVVRQIEGRKDDRAHRAWAKVEKAIQRVGAYDDVIFDDPIIHAVIDAMGGWVSLCHTSEKELPFRANHFRTQYHGMVNQRITYPKKLTGITNARNESQGYKPEPPKLIGNEDRAKQVYHGGSSTALPVTPMVDFAGDAVKQIGNERAAA